MSRKSTKTVSPSTPTETASPSRNGVSELDDRRETYQTPDASERQLLEADPGSPIDDRRETYQTPGAVERQLLEADPGSRIVSETAREARQRIMNEKRKESLAAQALLSGGGARGTSEVDNMRTCLLDAITNLLPQGEKINLLRKRVLKMMTPGEDTSVKNIESTLTKQNMSLEYARGKYKVEGGYVNLLRETKCRLIIQMKLCNLENKTISHYVAWDGVTIFDKPTSRVIDRDRDLASKNASKMAFGSLFPRSEFKSWQIYAVYQLKGTLL